MCVCVSKNGGRFSGRPHIRALPFEGVYSGPSFLENPVQGTPESFVACIAVGYTILSHGHAPCKVPRIDKGPELKVDAAALCRVF